jgi:uncharacterized protein (DUF924 family)
MTIGPSDVLAFWFGLLSDGFAEARVRRRWFRSDAQFDAEIRTRFGAAIQCGLDGALVDWLVDSQGRLAFIVLMDQLTRNAHRGTALAFAGDRRALAAAHDGVALRQDLELGIDERSFFYLPFEHAESLIDQHTSVGLFTKLRDDSPQERRRHTNEALRYAVQHRDIVLRFGRFPHRNALLERDSTADELAYLATASRFGQGQPP